MMSEVTWESLSGGEQTALAFAVENKFVRGVSGTEMDFDEWPFDITNHLHKFGLLEPFISDSAPDPEYTLYSPTSAGRALLPAGEAGYSSENPMAELIHARQQVNALQADLAAALARAEKAEGEAARLRDENEKMSDRFCTLYEALELCYPTVEAYDKRVAIRAGQLIHIHRRAYKEINDTE